MFGQTGVIHNKLEPIGGTCQAVKMKIIGQKQAGGIGRKIGRAKAPDSAHEKKLKKKLFKRGIIIFLLCFSI